MATTFKVLAGMADWTATATPVPVPVDEATVEAVERENGQSEDPQPLVTAVAGLSLHHDVHLHLPSTSDSAVYVAIFRALKAELLD